MKSLASQLTLILIALTAALLLSVWLVVYVPVVERLRQQDRDVMKDLLGTMRVLLQTEGHQPWRLKSRVEQEWSTRAFDRTYVRITAPNGSLFVQSPEVDQLHLLNGVHLADVSSNQLTRFEVGGMVLVGTRFSIPEKDGEKPYLIEIAFDRTAEANLFKLLRKALFGLTLFGFVICFVGARVFTSRALRPLRELSKKAASVNSHTLRERIGVANYPAEFTELATTLNEMLDRLGESFERLTRFSSDMAHELRTPVNNMMGVFGVALSKAREPGEYALAIESGIEECDRLKRIIESLLFIARAKNPAQDIQLHDVNLRDELSAIIGFYEASAEDSGIRIKLSMPLDFTVQAERTLLQRALGNLLSNAIRYSDANTVIEVVVDAVGDRVLIHVNDQGRGIDKDLITQIGERFFRADPSRSQASGGTGLGLSIVKVIAQIHGGRFEIQSSIGSGTSVRIDFAQSQIRT